MACLVLSEVPAGLAVAGLQACCMADYDVTAGLACKARRPHRYRQSITSSCVAVRGERGLPRFWSPEHGRAGLRLHDTLVIFNMKL